MKTGTKAIIALSVAALLGGASLTGASYADGRWGAGYYGDHGYGHYGYGYEHGRRGHHFGRHDESRRMGRRLESLLEAFDSNQDGKLTQAEVDAARASRLAEFDGDSDGRLMLQEYQALWLDAMRERMVDRFQDLDDDGDAVVTVEEFAEPYGRIVRRMDRNGDGALSAEDFRRPMRERDDDD